MGLWSRIRQAPLCVRLIGNFKKHFTYRRVKIAEFLLNACFSILMLTGVFKDEEDFQVLQTAFMISGAAFFSLMILSYASLSRCAARFCILKKIQVGVVLAVWTLQQLYIWQKERWPLQIGSMAFCILQLIHGALLLIDSYIVLNGIFWTIHENQPQVGSLALGHGNNFEMQNIDDISLSDTASLRSNDGTNGNRSRSNSGDNENRSRSNSGANENRSTRSNDGTNGNRSTFEMRSLEDEVFCSSGEAAERYGELKFCSGAA